jgi:hypothetical protein
VIRVSISVVSCVKTADMLTRPDGCDFNSYRMGNQDFYGTGMTVDTSKPVTVVTQFITDDGTDTGSLKSIHRFYVQNGKVIPNSESMSFFLSTGS